MGTHTLTTKDLLNALEASGTPDEYEGLAAFTTDYTCNPTYAFEVCGEELAWRASRGSTWESPYDCCALADRIAELTNWKINELEQPSVKEVEQEQYVSSASGGVKADGGKPMPRLLHVDLADALAQCVDVLTYGANKYSPTNWKKVEESRYIDALYRHLGKYHRGELIDAETGKTHLTHAATNLLILLQRQLKPND